MSGISMTNWPWNHFRDFIAPEADRFAMLKKLMEQRQLTYNIITIEGNRHFFIASPPREEGFGRRNPTILVAHYDRYPGSPGPMTTVRLFSSLWKPPLSCIKIK